MADLRGALRYFLVLVFLEASHFRGLHAIETFPRTCESFIDLTNTDRYSGVLIFELPLSMDKYSDPRRDLNCDVRIMFSSGLQLQIELFYLDIIPMTSDQSKCSSGLEVMESYSGRNIYGGRLCMEGWRWEERHFEREKEKKLIEASPVTFRFVSGAAYKGNGYRVHFNLFRANGVCLSREFRCREFQRCIADQLTCDGYDDCGDNSDEDREAGCGVLSDTEIVALTVGIILFLETIAVIVIFCVKYRHLSKNYKMKSQLSLASSNQNLKPKPIAESEVSFPHRFNSMESMNKSNYSRRTGTRRDSDSSIDKNDYEKGDRHSYKDNASERSYRSRQSETRKNGYQKRRNRGVSPASLSRDKIDPVDVSLKGSQPDLGTNSEIEASDKERIYREKDRERERKYRDRRRDDRYSDSDDRSPPRRRRSSDRRRYDRSSEDDDYDSEYEEERRRRRRRRSQDRRSRDRCEDDPDYSDNSDLDRERERRRRRRRSQERRSRDQYEDDPDRSDNSDTERRRRRSRDRYNRDDEDNSDDDKGRGRRRRSSRDRGRDRYDREPDSYDDEDFRQPRRRKQSQEREKRKDDFIENDKYDHLTNRDIDRRRDDVGDDSGSQPSYGRASDPNRQKGRSELPGHQRPSPSVEKDQWKKSNEGRMGSRENIISPQNHQKNSPPPTPPHGEDLRRQEKRRNTPSQPTVDDSKNGWKPRSERRRRNRQDETALATNGNDSPPPIYEDVRPRIELENLGYREEAV